MAVRDVESPSNRMASAAMAHQNTLRLGWNMAAAAKFRVAIAIRAPKVFFSTNSPRQAPGKISVIRPSEGTATATTSDMIVMAAKATARTSTSSGQRHRARRSTRRTAS